MSQALVYVLFFCSGVSGLIYQLAWVRQFGHAFGNTVHSTALVIAIFMLGLGVGGYVAGVWADRRYQSGRALLRAYAYAEALLALLGLAYWSCPRWADWWRAFRPTPRALRAGRS
jgi:spermidine synthase